MHGRSRVPLRVVHASAGPLLVAPGRVAGRDGFGRPHVRSAGTTTWASLRPVAARSGDVADELLDVVVQEVGEVVRCDEASVLRRDVGGRGVN